MTVIELLFMCCETNETQKGKDGTSLKETWLQECLWLETKETRRGSFMLQLLCTQSPI